MKIKCEKIFKSFTKEQNEFVINGASFEVDSGDSLAISGPSGVGKSTLLNILAGQDDSMLGDVYYNNICFTKLSHSKKILFRLNNISHIFQSPNLLKDFNVLENIMIPLRYKGVSKTRSRQIAISHLNDFNLSETINSPVSTLSGGEAQRVGIARALAMDAKIILADEPTGNLDSTNSESVVNALLESCRVNKITLIVVSHDEKVISKMNNKRKMIDGEII